MVQTARMGKVPSELHTLFPISPQSLPVSPSLSYSFCECVSESVCVPPDACRTRPVWVGVTHSVGVLFHFLCFLAFFQCDATGQSLSVATSVILLFVQGGKLVGATCRLLKQKPGSYGIFLLQPSSLYSVLGTGCCRRYGGNRSSVLRTPCPHFWCIFPSTTLTVHVLRTPYRLPYQLTEQVPT